MTGLPDRQVIAYPERPADTHPETLAWIAIIERIRADTAPTICPSCESTVVVTQQRRCYGCTEQKPITAFARSRGDKLGREYLCKACKRARGRVHDAERKRRQFRAVLGRAS